VFAFPALDCHAHVDPTVTRAQVATLQGAHVFAMTRTLDEARRAQRNPQPGLHWAVGTHPGAPRGLENWELRDFKGLAGSGFLVGEIGLDRRASSTRHRDTFRDVLRASSGRVKSVHSAGAVNQVLEVIDETSSRGVILHWFLGSRDQVDRAVELGCFFSVNAAMPDEVLRSLPYERVLPETDFPASRSKTRASKPGDIRALEATVSRLTRLSPERVRRNWYITLGRLFRDAAVEERVPTALAQLASAAAGGRPPDPLR
jgi:TatD DNase family protein